MVIRLEEFLVHILWD